MQSWAGNSGRIQSPEDPEAVEPNTVHDKEYKPLQTLLILDLHDILYHIKFQGVLCPGGGRKVQTGYRRRYEQKYCVQEMVQR